MTQKRVDILANVMLACALAKVLGVLVIMRQCPVSELFEIPRL
jgi:hypothetical protein